MSNQTLSTPGPTRGGASESSPSALSKISATAGRLLSGSGGALVGLIALFLVMSIFAPYFLTSRNLVNIVDQITVLGILSLGATAVIITGGIDL
ncbi:MAG TPA: ABC transporter permease, partial [Glaciihabitans sp.]|nr:ABC transporter permease [Glaciihabitans sp.]